MSIAAIAGIIAGVGALIGATTKLVKVIKGKKAAKKTPSEDEHGQQRQS